MRFFETLRRHKSSLADRWSQADGVNFWSRGTSSSQVAGLATK
jgi:hypothetical protein